MPFIPKVWKNKNQGTPYTYVTAEDLNRIEQGVSTAIGLAEQGGASDGQVAQLVSDPTSETKTTLDATYVRTVNGVPVDPATGNVDVAGGGGGTTLTKDPATGMYAIGSGSTLTKDPATGMYPIGA